MTANVGANQKSPYAKPVGRVDVLPENNCSRPPYAYRGSPGTDVKNIGWGGGTGRVAARSPPRRENVAEREAVGSCEVRTGWSMDHVPIATTGARETTTPESIMNSRFFIKAAYVHASPTTWSGSAASGAPPH